MSETNKKLVDCYLSLGGNIGDPAITIDDTLSVLANTRGIEVVTRSRFYKTPPWGKTDQASFINACAHIRTNLPAQDLLTTCLAIEKDMGRVRGEQWGPRVIDIDILTYGAEVIRETNLTIPHPHMMGRAFVLVPLRDIAPDFESEGLSLNQALVSLDASGIIALDAELKTA